MDDSLDPNAETIIYDIAGDVVELDDAIEIPERWEDLSESEYAALLDQIGIPIDEIDEIFEDKGALPIVAVVGRPNVGKSTLVNRIIGRREAVVEDTPGVTRDRVRYETEWSGVPFIVVDTGGWEYDAIGMSAQVSAQAEAAINQSDVVVFVVDATVGATDADEQIVRVLRQAKVPVILVANKVDDERAELEATRLWSLGLRRAIHGFSITRTWQRRSTRCCAGFISRRRIGFGQATGTTSSGAAWKTKCWKIEFAKCVNWGKARSSR